MSRFRTWLRFLTQPPVIAMMAVLALGAAWTVFSRPGAASPASYNAPPSPRIGFAAPDFTLDTLDGGSIRLSELRGRPVMLNLWASWCLPCRTEMPAIQKVHQRLGEEGPVVIGLNVTSQDSEAAAREFAQEFGLTFPIALDRDGSASKQYQLMGLPSTYFIDRQGIVRDVIIGGPMSEGVMLAKIEELEKNQ
jgi:cytochrome c biogenesis protein CcmG, thiol:disulfide interchange protein DsbE